MLPQCALDLACMNGHVDVVKLLLEKGADLAMNGFYLPHVFALSKSVKKNKE